MSLMSRINWLCNLTVSFQVPYTVLFQIFAKYVLKLKSEINIYGEALEDVCKLLFQFWMKLSLTLCLNIFKSPGVSHTLCNIQTSLKTVLCSKFLTCIAQFDLWISFQVIEHHSVDLFNKVPVFTVYYFKPITYNICNTMGFYSIFLCIE